jgi:hypothetical protein
MWVWVGPRGTNPGLAFRHILYCSSLV